MFIWVYISWYCWMPLLWVIINISIYTNNDLVVTETTSLLSTNAFSTSSPRRVTISTKNRSPINQSSIAPNNKKKPKQKKQHQDHQNHSRLSNKSSLSSLSLGERIQNVHSLDELLDVSSDFWLPTDSNLPTYYYTQTVHNEKRRRWASQLLSKLEHLTSPSSPSRSSSSSLSSLSSVSSLNSEQDSPSTTSTSQRKRLQLVLDDPRFTRLVLAACLPQLQLQSSSQDSTTTTTRTTTTTTNEKIHSWMLDALMGIYVLIGRYSTELLQLVPQENTDHDDADDGIEYYNEDCEDVEKTNDKSNSSSNHDYKHSQMVQLRTELVEAIQSIIDHCLTYSNQYSLQDACQLQWTVSGLRRRISNLPQKRDQNNDHDHQQGQSAVIVHNGEMELSKRLQELPFDIIPLGIDWADILSDDEKMLSSPSSSSSSSSHPDLMVDDSMSSQHHVCQSLVTAIPFHKDSIVTRQGTTVIERRGTAWVADNGIGALAYSGKLMIPHSPLPWIVKKVMIAAEQRLATVNEMNDDNHNHDHDMMTTDFFDCALCNHYADRDAACKYHTDPEHGTFWHTTTVVVAAGSDRKFSFKPIAETTRTTWQDWDLIGIKAQAESATIHIFSGDMVVMKDTCNDDFYHAVHAGSCDDDRVSLVLKRALDRNGRKGHGLPGQGRRRKRMNRTTTNNQKRTGR